ncbi:MAG: hypothetical protein ACYCSN_00195 [Acidobacteriaceae bacterium]
MHTQKGFVDYVLNKVNPNGTDYGAALQADREAIVTHTVDDVYFWSNVLTLLLLTGAVAILILQLRSADKKEIIAAALITGLWNARVSDRIEIGRRTEQFNRLVETHNADVERALMLKTSASESTNESNGTLSKNVQKVTAKDAVKTFGSDPTQLRLDIGKSPQLSTAEALDAQQEKLLLQRRLEALQNSELNLKQRLNQTTLLLDQERRRNASLKGA